MNFHKNDLIDAVLLRFFDTFRCTLDTADFVPEKYNDKILAYIFKNMKKAFRCIDREDKRYQRVVARVQKMSRSMLTTGVNDLSDQAAPTDQDPDDRPPDPTER